MIYAILGGLGLLASLGQAASSTVTFNNEKRLLFDVDGNQIDAYGAKVNLFNGSYYLYGNSFAERGTAFGINSYSSVDLVNWQANGFLFDPTASNPCNSAGGCGRPHIIYRPNDKQYVLWANAGSSGYAVATSFSPAGPFTFLNTTAAIDPRFNGLQPADFAVETIGSQGYLVFSVLNFRDPNAGSIWPPISQTLHISPLTPDFTNTTLKSYNVTSSAFDLIDQETESPDLFKHDGMFYVAAGNTCGYCNGSIGLIYRSNSIQGPWVRQIISGDSCEGQVEGVLPLSSSPVWHSTSVPGGPRVGFGGHIFQPLRFDGSGAVKDLDCSSSATFNVQFQPGSGASARGAATKAGDASPLQAAYTPVCDSDEFTLFQTWTASRSGTLKSVSVNVAQSVQTVPLSITVFKFSDEAALVSPGYKWTTLGSASFNSSSLTYVFDVATVNVTSNSAVSKDDMLGFSFSGMDFAPYCHLEYNTSSGGISSKLFVQGSGQNSWRGAAGNTSPVYQRTGRGMKFFATYGDGRGESISDESSREAI